MPAVLSLLGHWSPPLALEDPEDLVDLADPPRLCVLLGRSPPVDQQVPVRRVVPLDLEGPVRPFFHSDRWVLDDLPRLFHREDPADLFLPCLPSDPVDLCLPSPLALLGDRFLLGAQFHRGDQVLPVDRA